MKKNILSLLLILSVLSVFGQTATVHVQDVDASAIEGASVMLDGTSLLTDGNGDAIFPGLADGTYPYTVAADCYVAGAGSITIAGADNSDTAVLSLSTTNDVFVNLVPPGGIGFPPSGVTVRLYNDDLSYDQTVVTGGFTIFEAVPYGTYNYTLSQDCKVTVTGTTTVECTPGDIDALVAEFGLNQTTNDVFVNLVPPGGIGFPPSGVTVRLYNDDLSYDETVVTGGFTIFEAVPYGTYNYTLSQDCKVTVTGTTTVECTPGDIDALVAEFGINQNTNDVFVNLVPPGGIGFPPSGVTVRLYNDDLSYDQTVVTGGFTIFEAVPYGTYNYTLSQDCKVTVTGTTTVECTPGDIDALVAEFGLNQTTNDVFVNLVPPGGIGFPPSGVTVRLYNDDLSYDQTVVTGGFTIFEAVPYGTYNYTLSQDCKVTVTGTTTVECTPGDIDALVAEFGLNQTTNDVFVNLVPPGGIGFPPSGVTVRLYNDDLSYDQTVVTGGFTMFEAVPYGTYNYTLSQDCKVTVTGTTTVECTPGDIDALVAEFGLNQTTNDVFVNLVPPGGIGFPPSGVTVRLYNGDFSYDQTLVTGGFTSFQDVPYGTYNYTLSQDCKQTVTGTTTVECTPGDIDALVAEFGLNQTTNNLFFFVGNIFQEPGCTITVTNTETFEQTSITGLDILGSYVVQDLPYGEYNYTVSKDCFVSQTGQVTVDCQPNDGEGNQLGNIVALGDMVPTTTNNVFFFVGNIFQEPGCTITMTNTETFEQTSITGLDILGSYVLQDLPYGEYNYTVSKDCFVSQTGQVTVDCQPNDGEGNQLGNIVALGDMVPTTTNNVFFFVGNIFQEPGCTITMTNTETFEQTSITGLDILGSYVVQDLPYGEYNYTVSKDCFVSQTGQVTVDCQPNDGEGNQLGNIVALGDMVPTTTNNVFFFVGNIFQEPGCTITMTNTETFEQTSITGLDILGSYVVQDLPYGEYNYTVSKDCFVSQTGQVTVDCQPNDGEGNQLGNVVALGDMVPTTTNNVFFFVGNIFQEPGCTITMTNTETFEQTSITGLDILGSYVVQDLPYGEYNYTVSKDCFVSQTGQVTVDCQPNDGEGNQLGNVVALGDMVPQTTNNLFFFVGLLQEPGCTITVTNTETSEQTSITGLDILGSYVLENLPYGTYDYIVSKDCFVSQTGQVEVNCQPNDGEGNQLGNIVALDGMVPSTTGELQFSVTDDLSMDLDGAEIRVFTTDLTYDQTIISSAAGNSFADVPYGEVNYEVSQEGKMTVTGTITIECQEGDLTSIEVVLVTIVGLTDADDQVFELSAYPNPFANEFSIQLTSTSQDKVQIMVYDMMGRLVEQRSSNVAELQTTTLGNNYPAGVYNILVSQGDYRKTFLVVKK